MTVDSQRCENAAGDVSPKRITQGGRPNWEERHLLYSSLLVSEHLPASLCFYFALLITCMLRCALERTWVELFLSCFVSFKVFQRMICCIHVEDTWAHVSRHPRQRRAAVKPLSDRCGNGRSRSAHEEKSRESRVSHPLLAWKTQKALSWPDPPLDGWVERAKTEATKHGAR